MSDGSLILSGREEVVELSIVGEHGHDLVRGIMNAMTATFIEDDVITTNMLQ